jgi:hypothetical protein
MRTVKNILLIVKHYCIGLQNLLLREVAFMELNLIPGKRNSQYSNYKKVNNLIATIKLSVPLIINLKAFSMIFSVVKMH